MTISSALVGFTTGDQRQTSAAGSTTPVIADTTTALKAGPWSAIDWEFGSLLQALMPDAKDEAATGATGEEKADPTQAGGVPPTATQTPAALPMTLPNLWLALQRAAAPSAPVQEPEPALATPAADSKNSDGKPVDGKPQPVATQTDVIRVVPRLFTSVESAPKHVKLNSVPVAKNIPVRTDGASTKENTVEAEVVGATAPARTTDVVPALPPSPLPPDIRVETQPTGTESSSTPAKENTLEAEIVSAPVIGPVDVALTPLLTKDAEMKTVTVKEKTVARAESTPVDSVNTTPAPVASDPRPIRTGTEPVLTNQNRSEAPAVETGTASVADMAPRIQRAAAHIEKAPARTDSERAERQADPKKENIESAQTTLPQAVELQTPPIPTPAAVEPVEAKSAGTTPVAAPRFIAPERRADDPPKSQVAGLIVAEAPKPERSATEVTPDQPALPADRKSADLSQPLIPESKGKNDQPSPNDTEVSFTGRLVPRKPADEPVARPDSIEPRLERIPAPSMKEASETPAERPVEHDRPVVLRTEPGVVISAVHRDVAPAAAERPAEAVHTPRTASSENIPEPLKSETAGPVREISMRVNGEAQDSAHLRVVEKGGEVLVSVRSGSEQLARTLSSDLGDLAHRLEQTGFQAELYRPSAAGSSSEPGQDRRDNSSTADQNANQSWSRERRDSQQHPGQQAHEWVDDLEESMGLTQ